MAIKKTWLIDKTSNDINLQDLLDLPVKELHKALKVLKRSKWGYFKELSEKSGVNTKTISAIMVGRTNLVKYGTWKKLSDAEPKLPKPPVEVIREDDSEYMKVTERQKSLLKGYELLDTDRKIRFLEFLELMISAQKP